MYVIIKVKPFCIQLLSALNKTCSYPRQLHYCFCENCNTKKETCHRNEMYRLPQIRYMAIDKLLELQNCTWSVSMWFQYGVKPPCAAIRVCIRRGMEAKRPWIYSWGTTHHAVCMRLHKVSRVGAGGPWRIRRRPTISQTCSMGDISGERAGQGSSDTHRLWKKAFTVLATCGRALSCWNMACGVAWRRVSTSDCKISLM